ncbi:hypothetical protein JVU11DRAFT_6044 [Chiua virens]|nr:hypothetical protein JVU11DRAFT_6044 [Chiua virens]
MVVVAASSQQPNELEQKKRRQTLERAKANHLSKQLQMRLQYAKLKVEHGWQRQNLNEVENLYFHHSHQRTMRQNAAHRPPYPNTNVTQTPAETLVLQSPTPATGVPDRNEGPSPSAGDLSPPGSDASQSQSPPDHTTTTDWPTVITVPATSDRSDSRTGRTYLGVNGSSTAGD